MYLSILMALLVSFQAHAVKYCNPARSKPCGKGCIALDLQCTKSWSTSRVGINPDSGGKKHYKDSEVKLVDKAPENEIAK